MRKTRYELAKSSGNRINRRRFLQYSTLATGGLFISPVLSKAGVTYDGISAKESFWYNKPLRIMHTVLRETDARNYNADAVVDYMQKAGYNTLCVNAGGIVDFFQNPLLAANPNKFMGSRDILNEISSACRSAGIKVIARIDFRGVEEHIYNKFPDWFKKDENQNPVLFTHTRPVLYESCYSNVYRNEYANEFISYVLKNYSVDGIWHNAPGFGGICYCHKCQESFKENTGKDLPMLRSSSEAEIDEYMVWKAQAADKYMDKLKKTIKSFGKDKVYTAEVFSIYGVGSGIDSGVDLESARKHFDIMVSVAFLTPNRGRDEMTYEDLNYGSTIIKFLKSMTPEREAVVMYGGNGTSHRLVIDPPVDLKIWLWEMISAGGTFWNCYFSNVPTLTNDNRNAFNESDACYFIKENEKLLEQHIPFSNIGIYYSNPTRVSYRQKSIENSKFGLEIRGVESVLMENHIPHDFILNDQVSKERLEKYRLVILPNVRCMSDIEIEVLKEYVRNGGRLLATYETSLYDHDGIQRKDFGLSELFGVNYLGKKEDTRRDNFQFVLNKKHPIVEPDSTSTELLFNSNYTVLSKPTQDAEVICTLTPIIHNQPPDKSWVDKFQTEFPTIVENVFGNGSVIYFSNQPDVMSYTIGHPDPRNLLLRSIKHLAGNFIVVDSNAPSSVHIGLTKSIKEPGNYILSLVNTTSGPFRPIRELVSVNNIQVKLKLEGRSLRQHKVLRSQGDCSISYNGGQITIKISKLDDFCAIHFQMKV